MPSSFPEAGVKSTNEEIIIHHPNMILSKSIIVPIHFEYSNPIVTLSDLPLMTFRNIFLRIFSLNVMCSTKMFLTQPLLQAISFTSSVEIPWEVPYHVDSC